MKTDVELAASGFTESGARRYTHTTNDYCDQLFSKAIAFGDVDKASDAPREVTHDHVRSAAISLAARSYTTGKLQVAGQIGEYVFTALAGVGGGKLDKPGGVLLFGISLTIAAILVMFRIYRGRTQ